MAADPDAVPAEKDHSELRGGDVAAIAGTDIDYQVTVFEEDDDPEALIGDAIEFDLSPDEEE